MIPTADQSVPVGENEGHWLGSSASEFHWKALRKPGEHQGHAYSEAFGHGLAGATVAVILPWVAAAIGEQIGGWRRLAGGLGAATASNCSWGGSWNRGASWRLKIPRWIEALSPQRNTAKLLRAHEGNHRSARSAQVLRCAKLIERRWQLAAEPNVAGKLARGQSG